MQQIYANLVFVGCFRTAHLAFQHPRIASKQDLPHPIVLYWLYCSADWEYYSSSSTTTRQHRRPVWQHSCFLTFPVFYWHVLDSLTVLSVCFLDSWIAYPLPHATLLNMALLMQSMMASQSTASICPWLPIRAVTAQNVHSKRALDFRLRLSLFNKYTAPSEPSCPSWEAQWFPGAFFWANSLR